MGFPARSPRSDFFQGTIYMTLGCSRSPVTVAVPNSSLSDAPGFFWTVPAGGRAAVAGGRAAAGGREVLALGSPASDCGVLAAGAGAAEVFARGSPASD